MKFFARVSVPVLIMMLCLNLHSFPQGSNNFEILKNLEIYSSILKELDKNYAEEINPGDLNEIAIEAMLEDLDPYTVYIPESQSEDYKLLTTGQYGGIGALIHRQGDYVVISEPYEGSPAQKSGLKAGDRILEINGQSAKGKSTEEVSEILKGQPGVTLEIKIQGYSDEEPVIREVVRENIKIPNIPYYGMIGENIAYIMLANFAKNAGDEVKKALTELKSNNDVKGVILDLRGNGGGLLHEAVNLANIFVDKGNLIVSTKGKISSRNTDYYTLMPAVDSQIPVVVLVDGSSASASEIVAGAIQDLDRGVIIGQKTFGKGLVQNVVPLPYNSQLKITVSKYYISSGRCIQAIDYFHKDGNGNSSKIPDSLISEFKTKNGRSVYDGGGIEPDITTDEYDYSSITAALVTKFLIFDYANRFYSTHPTIDQPEMFQVDDLIYDDFLAFLQDKDYDYKTRTEESLEDLMKDAQDEDYFSAIQEDYEIMKRKLSHDKEADLLKHKEEIRELLREEIVSRYYYQKGRIIANIGQDKDIERAVEVLVQQSTYLAILNGTYQEGN